MAEATLKELLATSSLAFSGTVRSLGESPVAGVDADAVVRGHVIALHAVDPRETLHEHHPHWWIATLLVDLVQRGDVPDVGEEGGEVRVVYANSLDIRWRRWL